MSQDERLLLHLLDMDKYREMAQVPLGASQEGIAQAMGTQVHNASRALSGLEAEGLVSDRLAHVRGAPRRRRAYFLTDKGRQAADATRERVERSHAEFREGEVAKHLPLSEIARRIAISSRRIPSLLELADKARKGETIAASDFEPVDEETPERPSALKEAHGRSKVDRFFGRDRESGFLLKALSEDGPSTVHIYGMPGIGKSTLLSKTFDDLSDERSLFWYTFRDWDTERSFTETLARFLSRLGARKLSRALKAGSTVADLYAPLTADLKSAGVVLFLDDAHKVAEGMELLLAVLIDAARLSGGSKVVLISRVMLPFVPRDGRQSLSMEVGALDDESAARFVSSIGVKDPAAVLEDSHGHPLLLSLMVGKGTGGGRRDVIDFVDSEVYSYLSENERSVLEALSVFRHAVPMEALSGVDYDVVMGLRRKSLVTELEDGLWLHELLRDYFSSRLSYDRKERAHRLAGVYCASRQQPEWKLEALHHFVEAESWKEAVHLVLESGEELGREFPRETLDLIIAVPDGAVESVLEARFVFMRGQLREGLGNQADALADYEKSASMSPDSDDTRAAILESVARLRAAVDEWSKSLEAHHEALGIYEKSGDVDGRVREWLNIGVLHKRRGDTTRARESYLTALNIATKAENRAAQAACLNNIAILDWEEGLPGDAERKFRESVRMAHSAKDAAGEARALENFAIYLRSFQRLDESRHLLLEASGAHTRAGDIDEAKRLRSAAAEAMADLGRVSEAVALLRMTLADPALKRRRGLFRPRPTADEVDADLRLSLVAMLRESGDIGDARVELEEYMRLVEPLADPRLIARGKMEEAVILEESGDLSAAASALADAELVLTRAGDSEGLIALNIRLGIVEEKLGNTDVAAERYGIAEQLAKRMKNDKARTIAIENLMSVSNHT